jgi:hypothetical protein
VSAGRRSIGMTAIVTQRNARCQPSVLRVAGGCSRLRAALAALRRVQPCGARRARRPPLPLSRLMAGSAGRSPPAAQAPPQGDRYRRPAGAQGAVLVGPRLGARQVRDP